MYYDVQEYWLNDLDDNIYSVWNYLINDATPEEMLKCLNLKVNTDLNTLDIPEGLRNFLGFNASRGSTAPVNLVQKWCCQQKTAPDIASTINYRIKQTIKNLNKIKRFNITKLDYKEIPDITATWFIDPPYKYQGGRYKHSDIDYEELADWVKSRKGQVICCEQEGADYLPFKPFIEITGQKKKSTEVIWTNYTF